MLGFLYRMFSFVKRSANPSDDDEQNEQDEHGDQSPQQGNDEEEEEDEQAQKEEEEENQTPTRTAATTLRTTSSNNELPSTMESVSETTAQRRRTSNRQQERRQRLPILQLGTVQDPVASATKQVEQWMHDSEAAASAASAAAGPAFHLQIPTPVTCLALATMGMLRQGQTELDIRAPVVVLAMRRTSPCEQRVEIVYRNQILLSFPVSSKMPFEFLPQQHGMMWLMPVETHMFAFYLRFAHVTEEVAWTRAWSGACVESGRSQPLADVLEHPDEDLAWIQRAHRREVAENEQPSDEDVEEDLDAAMDAMSLQQLSRVSTRETATTDALSSEDESESDEDREEDEEDADEMSKKRNKSTERKSRGPAATVRNEHLAVSILGDRTYVTRDAQLGMFQHNNRGEMKFLFSLPKITDRNGDALAPTQLMLHEQDHKMLLRNAHDTTRVYELDIEHGKIVQEYGVSSDFHIGQIAPVTKYAERTPETVVTAVNNNSVFTLDARQSGANKLATHYTYQSDAPPQFSCVATTEQGMTVAASRTGAIRFYNDISKRAKTSLPGLGDGIYSIDTTADGRWVLATAETYLLLIPTFAGSTDNQDAEAEAEASGFTTSITGSAAAPIKLQLNPKDVINLNLQNVKFTPAHFSMGDVSGAEEWIVTSSGQFLITWNMRSIVRRRRYYDYKIKRCGEQVINNQFLFGHDDTLVVTLPNDLFTEKRVTRSSTVSSSASASTSSS